MIRLRVLVLCLTLVPVHVRPFCMSQESFKQGIALHENLVFICPLVSLVQVVSLSVSLSVSSVLPSYQHDV
jgi:hypothetical protein